MFNKSTYQAAKKVAPIIVNLFADHLSKAIEMGEENLATVPDTKAIESIIDAAFWASLRREEGNSPKISLALLPPELSGKPLLFEKRIKISPAALTKLAPGVERAGIHLGVWHEGDELYIWGTTHKIPNYCFVLDVSEPGLLVIKHRRVVGYGKFINVAVLIGDQIKIVDEESAHLPDCPGVLSSLLGFTTAGDDSINILIQLAVSMRAHKHGGTLLVVPSGSNTWKDSILHPIKYAIQPAFSGLSELIKQDPDQRINSSWQSELIREIDSIGGLTAVDGATVISDQHELLAFGGKIIRPRGKDMVEQIVVTEPIIGGGAIIVNPANNGGTRHISAAQFVHDQRDSLALVASQDGHFTVFTWSPCEKMVHAHRIDSLLV
jgi:hypothetical protein